MKLILISVWLFGSACGDCLLEWFVGQNVTQEIVPTYVFVKDYQDACGTVDVAYRSFYPYNYGKDVCVGKYERGGKSECVLDGNIQNTTLKCGMPCCR